MISTDVLEVTLSKGEAAEKSKNGTMAEFLADLAKWSEAMAMKGYTIVADPLEGPGTMRWRAVR